MRRSKPSMTAFERQRRDWCLAGHAVLANGHTDAALRAWAKHTGRLYVIDRRSARGNPEALRNPEDDAEREACVHAYASYFETKYDLHQRLDELAGKVLLCWCTPRSCHGEVLLAALDPQFAVEYWVTCRELVSRSGSPAVLASERRVSVNPQLPLWDDYL